MNPAPLPLSVQAYLPDFSRRFTLILHQPGQDHRAPLPARPASTAPSSSRWSPASTTSVSVSSASWPASPPAFPRAPAAPVPAARTAQPPNASAPRCPTGRGWLVRALGYEAALCATQLEAVLAEAGAIELLSAAPSLGRILRPIQHILSLNPATPRPSAPRPKAQAAQAPAPARACPPQLAQNLGVAPHPPPAGARLTPRPSCAQNVTIS